MDTAECVAGVLVPFQACQGPWLGCAGQIPHAPTGTLISPLWGPLFHSTPGVCINQCKPLRQFEFQTLKSVLTGFKPEIT